MRSFRALLWIFILGFAITVVVLLQRRGDEVVAAEAARSTPRSINTGSGNPQAVTAAVAAEAAANIAIPGDEVTAKCSQSLHEAAGFVSREAGPPVPASERSEEQVLAELANVQRSLAGARDPEHFLVALLLEPKQRLASGDATVEAKLLDLGERATRSGSKLLAWHALNACVAAKQFCPVTHLEQRLLEADRQNAEAWALVATAKYERGDTAGALAAMQGAARAPTSTWYWTETLALVERALATQTAMPYVDRMGLAFGVGGSVATPSSSNLLRMCKVEAAASRAWGEACLAFGTLRGTRNETVMARAIAYSLREQALAALGDMAGAEMVAAERAHADAERSAMMLEPAGSMLRLQQALIESDAARFHAYLGAIQRFGESAGARMFLRQEVPPLLERAGMIERDGVRECAAQFFVSARQATSGQLARAGEELHMSVRGVSGGSNRTVRIRQDGKVQLALTPGTRSATGPPVRPDSEIMAAGKTTAQLQREIAAVLSERYPSAQVAVTLLSRGSREELQREFNNAHTEAAARRSNSR